MAVVLQHISHHRVLVNLRLGQSIKRTTVLSFDMFAIAFCLVIHNRIHGLLSLPKEIMFSVVLGCLFVCLPVFLSVTNITQNVIRTDCNELLWKKWLHSGSDADHNPSLMEVCALWMLRIWWLSLDIGWRRSIIEWLSNSLTEKYILQRVNYPMILVEVCALRVFVVADTIPSRHNITSVIRLLHIP